MCIYLDFFPIGVQTSESTATLSDYLLRAVLTLLKREVSEHGRHLTQYFQLFQMYANLGLAEVSVIAVEEIVLVVINHNTNDDRCILLDELTDTDFKAKQADNFFVSYCCCCCFFCNLQLPLSWEPIDHF